MKKQESTIGLLSLIRGAVTDPNADDEEEAVGMLSLDEEACGSLDDSWTDSLDSPSGRLDIQAR